MSINNNILITGVPAVGKTTLIIKICQLIKHKYSHCFEIKGFYTQEVRNVNGQRIGFDVIDVNNSESRRQLSRIDLKSGPKVGKYTVDVKSFESFAIPMISESKTELQEKHKKTIIVIDEIGKMEMFSDLFKRTVKQLFASDFGGKSYKILATIPIQTNIAFVEELRKRGDTQEVCVQKSNRDLMADRVVQMLCENAIK